MLNNLGKKAIWAVIFVCLFCAQPAAKAWAEDLTVNKYANFYTVANSGSTDEVTDFTLDSKPWLYLQLDTDSNISNTISWSVPSSTDSIIQSVTTSGSTGTWISMTDADWDTYKTTGSWAVSGSALGYESGKFTFYASASDFTVTPEPLSCVLFVTGGGLLAVLKRKRKTVKA